MIPKKTQEERIKDATEALRTESGMGGNWERVARIALEAADAPPKPKWPSDESVEAFKKAYRSKWGYLAASDESIRDCLREAMLSTRILKTAIAHRNAGRDNISDARYQAGLRLDDAVNEAGL